MVSVCKVNRERGSSCTSKKKDLTISFGNLMPRSASQPSFLLKPLLTPVHPAVLSSPAQSLSERFENEPPTEVLSFLFVGNAKDSTDVELLRKLQIGYILSVTTNMGSGSPPPTSSGTTFSGCTGGGGGGGEAGDNNTSCSNISYGEQSTTTTMSTDEFKKFQIPVSDNLCDNLAPYFDAACEFIDDARKAGSKVLIHCQAGISRSPTLAIAYVMKYYNLSTLEAYAFVKNVRRIISPNLNFMGQLVEYESKLKPKGVVTAAGVRNSSENESSLESVSSLEES